jgi:hypothetical protein
MPSYVSTSSQGARGNLKLTVDEVCGDVTLGSSLSVTISEAKGTLASGGINVARYHCNSLVLKALLNHKYAFNLAVLDIWLIALVVNLSCHSTATWIAFPEACLCS